MARRGDDGGFERLMRNYFRAELGQATKPQDADATGDFVLWVRYLPPLVGEAKAYRDRASADRKTNPTLRAIRDAINGAAAAAEPLDGIGWGVVKRTGKAEPGDQLVVMEAREWVQLLQAVNMLSVMLEQHPPAKVEP